MDEKRISKAEFDAAVNQVMNNLLEDPRLEGELKLMIPLTGMTFAGEMGKILFSEDKESASHGS